jgi:hydroxysqualene synthase
VNPTADLPFADSQRHRAENFPVASWLCPAHLRPPILAIYRFARLADDIADEGDADAATRQAGLAQLRGQLRLMEQVQPCDPEHAALAQAIAQWHLPTAQLHALLDAFEQDTHTSSYATRAELLAYCQRSANPVGRLLLHLVGVTNPSAIAQSDAICTALQLINFWQDVGIDRLKGRVYLPEEDLVRHGLSAQDVLAGRDSPALRAAVRDVNAWALTLMAEGAALPQQVPGRLGWELRAVVAGGRRVAEKIIAMDHATLIRRPRLRAWDSPLLLWRTLWQRSP